VPTPRNSQPVGPSSTPCANCKYQPTCDAFKVLSSAIYGNIAFVRSQLPRTPSALPSTTWKFLEAATRSWSQTTQLLGIESQIALPSLFDVLVSALYIALLYDPSAGRLRNQAFVHSDLDTHSPIGYFPYIWMCPGCVAARRPPSVCYLPNPISKPSGTGERWYARPEKLSRPNGRMIGDIGALILHAIISFLTASKAHQAAGAGHRGEFDLILSNSEQLILGEIKASPLVAFPLAIQFSHKSGIDHQWTDNFSNVDQWSLFLGAADEGKKYIQISEPGGDDWPYADFLRLASNPDLVRNLADTWGRHLTGYREFNMEQPLTRWHRFGCGNIETRVEGKRVQQRVDNTKILPGLDRTDDIKKGIAQVMLSGRLKRGCRANAIKNVLFGNVYAETHHAHYVEPLANVKLMWSIDEPVWLFDGIVGLTRNIINDIQVERLLGLSNSPYTDDRLDVASLAAELTNEDLD
jgi:hypothetical protein